MNIKDILNESATDLVANFSSFAEDDFDAQFNPEAHAAVEMNRQHYKDYFLEFFENGIPPVFEKSDNHFDPDAKEWDHKPVEHEMQSAGYRGQQRALHNAGVPHDKNVQKFNPESFATRDAIDQRTSQ